MLHRSFRTMSSMLLFYSLSLHSQTIAAAAPAQLSPHHHESHLSSISPDRAARIDDMLTVTGTKPKLIEILKQGQSRLEMYALRKTVVPGVALESVKAVSPEEKKLTADYVEKMRGVGDTELAWEKLKTPILQYCAGNFTDEQLDSIIAFYKSPAGKAMQENGPSLNKTSFEVLEKLQDAIGARTDEITKAYIERRNRIHPPVVQPAAASKSTGKISDTGTRQ